MKKIISLLLVFAMVLSLAACGKDEPNVTEPATTEPVITEPEPETTEPVTTEPVVTEPEIEEPEPPVIPELTMPIPEMPADEILVSDKQAAYEKVFNEGLFTMDTNSVVMNFANLFEIGVLADTEGKSLMTISGSTEGLELELALYIVSDTEAYYHRKDIENGITSDEWYKVEGLVDENGDSTIGGMTETTDGLTDFQNNVKSITYVGVIDGKDAVELEYLVQDDMTETETYAKVVLLLDAETYRVSAMYMEKDGMLVAADFTPVEDLATAYEVPADVTETISAEDAGMEMAMGMMTFIFAAAGMAEGVVE